MKSIEETHPSLSSSCFFNTPGDSIMEEDKIKIQKHTVDKAVLREKINTIFNKWKEESFSEFAYVYDFNKEEILKELGLEEEDEQD